MSDRQHSQQSYGQRAFLTLWFGKHPALWGIRIVLWPLSLIFQWLTLLNQYYQKKRSVKLPVPLIIVGNITVGGTGKTPVVIALAKAMHAEGISVGIISRGYHSNAPYYPYPVNPDDCASTAGDEPLLIARSSDCPVVIGKDRVAAAKHLLTEYPDIEMIISDDGLQHYRLQRDVEIVVVDGHRGLGNHLLIPAGPLRESAHRLAKVDWVLLNQSDQQIDSERVTTLGVEPYGWCNIHTQDCYPLHPLPWKKDTANTPLSLKAITGIGNPARFFDTLRALDIHCAAYAYDDHYAFSEKDFNHSQHDIVLMTEKDAVKCQTFANKNWWSLRVKITLPHMLLDHLMRLRKL